jgi:hypothetical protein
MFETTKFAMRALAAAGEATQTVAKTSATM